MTMFPFDGLHKHHCFPLRGPRRQKPKRRAVPSCRQTQSNAVQMPIFKQTQDSTDGLRKLAKPKKMKMIWGRGLHGDLQGPAEGVR